MAWHFNAFCGCCTNRSLISTSSAFPSPCPCILWLSFCSTTPSQGSHLRPRKVYTQAGWWSRSAGNRNHGSWGTHGDVDGLHCFHDLHGSYCFHYSYCLHGFHGFHSFHYLHDSTTFSRKDCIGLLLKNRLSWHHLIAMNHTLLFLPHQPYSCYMILYCCFHPMRRILYPLVCIRWDFLSCGWWVPQQWPFLKGLLDSYCLPLLHTLAHFTLRLLSLGFFPVLRIQGPWSFPIRNPLFRLHCWHLSWDHWARPFSSIRQDLWFLCQRNENFEICGFPF